MASYRTLAVGLFAASAAVAKPIPNDPSTESTPAILVPTTFETSVTLTNLPLPTHVRFERALPPGVWARTSPSVSSKPNTRTVVVSRWPEAHSIIADWLPDWGDNTHVKRHIALGTPEPTPDWPSSKWRPAPFEDEDSVWPPEDFDFPKPQEQYESTSQASPEQTTGTEEQVEDFVLFVPQDQSKGSPYLVPASEYDGPIPDADSSEWYQHTWPAPGSTGVESSTPSETPGRPEIPFQLEAPHEPVPAPLPGTQAPVEVVVAPEPAPVPEAFPAPGHVPAPVPAPEPAQEAVAGPVPIVEPIPTPEAAPIPGIPPISEVGPAPQAAPTPEIPPIPDIPPIPEIAPVPAPIPAPEHVAAPLPEPHAPHPAPVPDPALAPQPHVEPHPPAPAAAAPAPEPPAPVAPALEAAHPPQSDPNIQPPPATPLGTLPEWFPDESVDLLERDLYEGQVPSIFTQPQIWENSREVRKEAQAPYAQYPAPDFSHLNCKDQYPREDIKDPQEDVQDPNQAPVCDPAKERYATSEGYEQPVEEYYPEAQYDPAHEYVPKQNCGPEDEQCASEGHYDPEQQYASGQQNGPEEKYVPEQDFASGQLYAPEQAYPQESPHTPKQQYTPEKEYLPERQYAPEKPYAHEPPYVPEQQYAPEPEYAPEQEYTPEKQDAPEEQYTPELQYTLDQPHTQEPNDLPEKQYAPQQEYVPEKEFVPENEPAPEQHYDPEQPHAPEQHEIPQTPLYPPFSPEPSFNQHETPQAPLYPAFELEPSSNPGKHHDPASEGNSDPACNDCGSEGTPPPHFAAGPQPHHVPEPLQKSQASPFIGLDRPIFDSPALEQPVKEPSEQPMEQPLEQPSDTEQWPVGFDPYSVIFGPSSGEPQQNYDQRPYPYPVYDDNTWTYDDHANRHPYWPQGQSPPRHDLTYAIPYQQGQHPNECVCEQGYQPCSYTGPGETYYTLPYEAPRHLRQSDHCCPSPADRPSHEGSYETYDNGLRPYQCPYYNAPVPYPHYDVEYHPPSYSSPPSGPGPYEYIPEGYHQPQYPGYGYFHPGGHGSPVIPLRNPNYECIQRRPLREGIYSPQGFDPTDRRSMPRWMY